jgi:UDP-3-O-[3-hydroxymyristoyl] glucosamine N-acyltransferase
MAPITVKGIHELLGMEASADERFYTNVGSFEDAGPNSIVFAENEHTLRLALETAAGLILAPLNAGDGSNSRILGVSDPKYAFAAIGHWLGGQSDGVIHPTAAIDDAATVGHGTSVGAYSVIEAGAQVGECCMIGSRVTIHRNTILSDYVVVQSGAVLGSTGFGYVRGTDGAYLRFPQQGRLWIGDEVEIGANTTIDRGALTETRIGRGVKIDNLVHIGHNVQVGADVVIAAQTGISGSSTIGDGAVVAGQVGIADHVTIGPGAILGAQCGVPSNKQIRGPGVLFWGTPARPIAQYLKELAVLARMARAGRGKRE